MVVVPGIGFPISARGFRDHIIVPARRKHRQARTIRASLPFNAHLFGFRSGLSPLGPCLLVRANLRSVFVILRLSGTRQPQRKRLWYGARGRGPTARLHGPASSVWITIPKRRIGFFIGNIGPTPFLVPMQGLPDIALVLSVVQLANKNTLVDADSCFPQNKPQERSLALSTGVPSHATHGRGGTTLVYRLSVTKSLY